MSTARTQDEIVARIAAVTDDDFMGWSREVLVDGLDYKHAKPFLNDGVTQADWDKVRPADISAAAQGYLQFAIGKIRDHRGISAGRSVDKLTSYAWLLGRDDVVAAMEAADYPQYGAPKVKAFAEGMGWPWPDLPDLARMADGLSCEDDCVGGCGG